MTVDQRIRRNLALAAAFGIWLAVVTARALEMLDWRWLWVLAPFWVPVAALVLFVAGIIAATLAMRVYLWLVVRAERRRYERERRALRRALEDGLRDLVCSRESRFRDSQPATRSPRT